MDLLAFLEKLQVDWPRMSAVSQIALGLIVGWAAGWVVFRQQLNHRADIIEHLRHALAEKVPPELALKLSGTAQSRRGAKMGLVLIFIGLLIAAVGLIVVYRQLESTSPTLPKSAATPNAEIAAATLRRGMVAIKIPMLPPGLLHTQECWNGAARRQTTSRHHPRVAN